jgi:TonB family protein
MKGIQRTIAVLALLSGRPSDVWAQAPVTNTAPAQSQSSKPPLPDSNSLSSLGRSPVLGHPHVCGMESYPPAAVRGGIQGSVVLAFTITTQGTVSDVKVAKSSGDVLLDEAAVKCVSTWLYNPVMNNGRPVAVQREAAVNWSLAPPPPPPSVTGLGLCSRILSSAQSMGVVPSYGQVTSPNPEKAWHKGRYVCSAATSSTKYTLTAEWTCPNLQAPACISMVSIVSDDGIVLYKRPD